MRDTSSQSSSYFSAAVSALTMMTPVMEVQVGVLVSGKVSYVCDSVVSVDNGWHLRFGTERQFNELFTHGQHRRLGSGQRVPPHCMRVPREVTHRDAHTVRRHSQPEIKKFAIPPCSGRTLRSHFRDSGFRPS